MIIRPELRALRGNDAPQRQAQSEFQTVLNRWREYGLGRQVEEEIAQFAAGARIEDLPLLSTLFAPDDSSAQSFVAGLVEAFVAELAASPLGQVPLRYSCDETMASLAVTRHGTAVLALQAVDGAGLARKPFPVSASFAPTETHERVLAGSGTAVRVRIASDLPDRAELQFEDVTLVPGPVRHRFGSQEAQLLRDVSGTLVTLKLQRRQGTGAVTREHLLADGRLVHQAAGTPRESRLELAAALLGRMGRADAAPLLAAIAEEEAAQSLRWEALRECLGLDSAVGFATLSRIAARPLDPLASPAGALRAQLLETYPQLSGVQPCPA